MFEVCWISLVSFSSVLSCNVEIYFWEFGDGVIFIDVNLDYMYVVLGNYIVSLIVINGCGDDFVI